MMTMHSRRRNARWPNLANHARKFESIRLALPIPSRVEPLAPASPVPSEMPEPSAVPATVTDANRVLGLAGEEALEFDRQAFERLVREDAR